LYDTKRWERIAHHQLQKEPLCRVCTAQGRVSIAEEVDHIIPHRGNERAILVWRIAIAVHAMPFEEDTS
jgi:5-methylcytosine-specific restriction endonuclease McrA